MANDPNELAAARSAKKKAKVLFRGIAPVSGVGITQVDHRYVVKVNLESEPEPGQKLPTEIDGVPVVVHFTGRVRKS